MKNKKVTGVLKAHLIWPIILLPLLIAMMLHLYLNDFKSGHIAAVYLAIYAVITLFIYRYKRSSVMSNLVNYAVDYNLTQKHLLKELDIPYANLDLSGHILWANDIFTDITDYNLKAIQTVQELFPELESTMKECLLNDSSENDIPVSEVSFEYNEKNYRAVLKYISIHDFDFANDEDNITLFDKSDAFIALYLYDETKLNEYISKIEEEDIVVGLLYIDNYEESLNNCDETQRALLMALVEKEIARHLQSLDGIYRKMEKDRYFFIFRKKYLEQVKANKFSILEDVRNVKVDDCDAEITISIGIGLHADSYSKRYEFAHNAIDLALGRGGNQAVIKDGEDFFYYGGKSVQKESNTRVRARVKALALNELILTSDQVFIMGHKNADIDSFGAAIGIYRISKALEHNAKIIITKEDCQSLDNVLDRFTSNPYYDNMLIDNEAAMKTITPNTLLVVVDVNLAHITQCPELLEMTKQIVVIDHHRQTGSRIENQVLSYIEPFSSSASEMVTELFQYIKDGIKPSPVEADTLYSGIMVDTNNFTTQANVRTFEAVAYLKRNGADITRIRKLFRSNSAEYLLRAEAISKAELYRSHFAITTLPDNNSAIITPATGAKVANALLEIEDIKASFVCFPYKSQIYINARSIDDVNVQLIMEKLGGGGHVSVAATQLEGTVNEAIISLKHTLNEMIQEGEIE